MLTATHVLEAPVSEGGAFVFTHAHGSGISVWMRGLARVVDERPRRLRGVAAPLYGGTIRDLEPLRDFVTDFVEHAVDEPAVRLTPGRIRDVRPIVARTNSDALSSRMHFSYRAMSPLDTVGPWDGAAAELLLSRVRGLDYRHMGFFATGLPELPAGDAPDAMAAAVISREHAEHLAEYLQAPAGQVLHHLRRDSPAQR
ncbi:hypothetical protein B9W64_37790 [Streptomyces sp. CS159]|uniref:hypothetical protein n=1 Tax=Streptomyces sp. CS159 TaxID=1982762 RepID=UPI000B41F1E0|nr:hypothetical protein [Streptomyces sp. CS159]OVZ99548.1 hypothetical protein B9W64_37790 [Streptomyces sp. CS159]